LAANGRKFLRPLAEWVCLGRCLGFSAWFSAVLNCLLIHISEIIKFKFAVHEKLFDANSAVIKLLFLAILLILQQKERRLNVYLAI